MEESGQESEGGDEEYQEMKRVGGDDNGVGGPDSAAPPEELPTPGDEGDLDPSSASHIYSAHEIKNRLAAQDAGKHEVMNGVGMDRDVEGASDIREITPPHDQPRDKDALKKQDTSHQDDDGAQAQAAAKAKEAEEREEARIKAEAERKAKEAQEREEARIKAEADRKAKEAQEREEARLKAEAERKAKEAEEREEARLKSEAERKAKEAQEREEARLKEEAERKAKEAEEREEARLKAEAASKLTRADSSENTTRGNPGPGSPKDAFAERKAALLAEAGGMKRGDDDDLRRKVRVETWGGGCLYSQVHNGLKRCC